VSKPGILTRFSREHSASAGARTILVNAEAPLNADSFGEMHLGQAGLILPSLVYQWLDIGR